MTRGPLPVLLGERVTGRTVCRETHRVVPVEVIRVWCPFCAMYHEHLPADVRGYHQTRCVGDSPGYLIREANGQEATW